MLDFDAHPGRWFVLAALLPLTAFIIQAALILGRLATRRRPGTAGAYIALVGIAGACVCASIGWARWLGQPHEEGHAEPWTERIEWVRLTLPLPADFNAKTPPPTARALHLGYAIDDLSAVLMVMVTGIATLIFLFSIGYMHAETKPRVEDHAAHIERRGRYEPFFLYLSLFCAAMLNLVIADNLLQVFVSWELVGICSYFLVGFYFERPSAADAATTAFVVNRIGDVGFLVALMAFWTFAGTLDIRELSGMIRCPPADSHGDAPPAEFAGHVLRGDRDPNSDRRVLLSPTGRLAVFAPGHWHATDLTQSQGVLSRDPAPNNRNFITAPYWLLVVAGLGLFVGCVGKSAQFPLHVWLPDAMEGPTPVSALIHAATMVAAGVYLVGRAWPLFTPEVLLTIAYAGAITTLLGATIAVVMNDIKRVLAYSTVSQLGLMMLALGVGGWVSGLLHLLTHAFFKALLFLGAGSVIHACHEEQDLRQMGGLWRKLPVTAFTMLAGVLAIIGTPFFSGWYSKDLILTDALAFWRMRPEHGALFLVPMAVAVLTAFYMPRLWLMAFAGRPRDEKVFSHSHESPLVMLVPLMVLAAFSVKVAWGWPLWEPHASWLGHQLHHAQPGAVDHGEYGDVRVEAEALHASGLVTLLAGGAAALGVVVAVALYGFRAVDPAAIRRAFGPLGGFLERRWLIDDAYRLLIVKPFLYLAALCTATDKRTGDASILGGPAPEKVLPPTGLSPQPGRADPANVDGLIVLAGQAVLAAGLGLRRLQTGLLRHYILVLALTAVALFALLSYLAG